MTNECPLCERVIVPAGVQKHIIDCVMARQKAEADYELQASKLREAEEARRKREAYLRAEGFQV